MDAFLFSPPGVVAIMLVAALALAAALSFLRIVIDTVSPPRGVS